MRIKKYEFPIMVGGSEFTHYATFLGERMEFSQGFLDQVGEKEALRRFRKMTIKGLPQRMIPRWIKKIFIRRTILKIESKASAVKELRKNPDKYKTAVRGK